MAASELLTTQRALAARAGIDQRTVGRVLNQEHSPNLAQITKLAEAFDLLPWQLLVPDTDPHDPPMIQLGRAEAGLYLRLRAIASDFGGLSRN